MSFFHYFKHNDKIKIKHTKSWVQFKNPMEE